MRFLMILWIVCGVSIGYASVPHSEPKQKPPQQGSDLSQPNMDGVVEVSFKIDSKGKAEILQINATSPKLADYVLKKLSKIQLDQSGSESGKVIKYRFVFKKQA